MKQLTLASLFQDHMVIQRDKPITVWGEGPENAWITVCFGKNRIMTQVIEHKWKCVLPAHSACYGMEMTILCDIPNYPIYTITDIAVGDVWLAGGQSNMEYFLRYDAHWSEIKNYTLNPNIRMFNVPRIAFEGQQKDTSDSGYWFFEHDSAWETFSAPAYCFARSLQPTLDIPIGIIGCNWGGSPACAWVPEEVLLSNSALKIFLDEYEAEICNKDPFILRKESLIGYAYEDSAFHQEEWKSMMYGLSFEEQQTWMNEHRGTPTIPMGPLHMWRPCGLYHHMLEPIAPFSLKGFLWYQGESDSGHASIYDQMLSALIKHWRALFQDELPFLLVQLAPFGQWLNCDSTGYSQIRHRQELVSHTVPFTYMTSIMDLGMYWDIHPKHKKEVGERLALLARGKVYGEDILCESPEFVSASRDEYTITITFLHTGTGLYLKGNSVDGLKIQNHSQTKDIAFKNCYLKQNCLVLEFDTLPNEPIWIEFANTGYVEVNLFNSANLPAKPFSYLIEEP